MGTNPGELLNSTDQTSFSRWIRTGYWLLEQITDPSLEVKSNPNHDPQNGRFTSGDGGVGQSSGSQQGDKAQSGSVDLDKMADAAKENALDRSHGQCAKYCRRALEAGGADTSGHPIDAKDYGPVLTKNGFSVVPSKDYVPQKGDVVVYGGNKTHPHGHIAIYNGSAWYSDFKQSSMNPYRGHTPHRTLYRHGSDN